MTHTNEQKCCGECREERSNQSDGGEDVWFECINPSCPCHSQPSEETDRPMTDGEAEIAAGLDKYFAPHTDIEGVVQATKDKWVLRLPHPKSKSGTEVVADSELFISWLRSTLTTLVEAAREEAVREHDAKWHPIVDGKMRSHDFETGKQAMREELMQSMSKIPAYGDGQIILKRQLISLLTPTDKQA